MLDLGGRRVGISICEDIWNDRDFWKRRRYHHDPVEELVRAGAQAIVNLSASPFTVGKHARREEMLGSMARQVRRAARLRESVRRQRRPGVRRPQLRVQLRRAADRARRGRSTRDVVICDLSSAAPIGPASDVDAESEIWRALVLGTRDYARKCGFTRVVLGLSGGIDSALTAAIAAEALGAGERARRADAVALFEPRQHRRLAGSWPRNLGIETLTLPIEDVHAGAWKARSRDAFAGTARDVTEENIQARIRGNLLMALSNKRGALLLTTGNKSELAVGYCTLYGDMSGGLGVIADVPEDDGLPRRAVAEPHRRAADDSRSRC